VEGSLSARAGQAASCVGSECSKSVAQGPKATGEEKIKACLKGVGKLTPNSPDKDVVW